MQFFTIVAQQRGFSVLKFFRGVLDKTQAKIPKSIVSFYFSGEKYLAHVTLFQMPFEVIILLAFVTVDDFLPL